MVREPHKELRFTRAGQAQLFYILAAIFVIATLLLALMSGHPDLAWWIVLSPLPFSVLFARLAWSCTKHAYLILTPLGIEVFPFYKPADNLQLYYWSEFELADFDEHKNWLTLHHNSEKKSGLVLSLKPILASQRPLLQTAIEGRLLAALEEKRRANPQAHA